MATTPTCPECDAHASKNLSVRVHECPECGYKTDRDVAAAQVVRNRGISAVGQTVDEIACGRDASGAEFLSLGGTGRDRKFLEAILGSPSHNLGFWMGGCHSRSEADNHKRFLSRFMPAAEFEVVFDAPPEEDFRGSC